MPLHTSFQAAPERSGAVLFTPCPADRRLLQPKTASENAFQSPLRRRLETFPKRAFRSVGKPPANRSFDFGRRLPPLSAVALLGSSSKALFNFAPRELLSITQAKFLCKRLFRVLLKSFLIKTTEHYGPAVILRDPMITSLRIAVDVFDPVETPFNCTPDGRFGMLQLALHSNHPFDCFAGFSFNCFSDSQLLLPSTGFGCNEPGDLLLKRQRQHFRTKCPAPRVISVVYRGILPPNDKDALFLGIDVSAQVIVLKNRTFPNSILSSRLFFSFRSSKINKNAYPSPKRGGI